MRNSELSLRLRLWQWLNNNKSVYWLCNVIQYLLHFFKTSSNRVRSQGNLMFVCNTGQVETVTLQPWLYSFWSNITSLIRPISTVEVVAQKHCKVSQAIRHQQLAAHPTKQAQPLRTVPPWCHVSTQRHFRANSQVVVCLGLIYSTLNATTTCKLCFNNKINTKKT